MLVDTKLTMAYKCPFCGSYEIFQICLFNLTKMKKIKFKCKCNQSEMKIVEKLGVFNFLIPCIACEKVHTYKFMKKDLVKDECLILKCPEKLIDICLIGSDKLVRKRLDLIEKELDELIDYFGYDNYFDNTQVMFDTLNIINEIAERGDVYCQCEKPEFEMVLLHDKICLSCGICQNLKIIKAASNEDFKNTKKMSFVKLDLNKIKQLRNGKIKISH